MNLKLEYIAKKLKSAREKLGLSQRALSQKADAPQGHISKIENGEVDLRVTSLIDLARVLDLELTLVPRKTIPAVNSIVRNSELPARTKTASNRAALKELSRTKQLIDDIQFSTSIIPKEISQIQRILRDLNHFQTAIEEASSVVQLNKMLEAYERDRSSVATLQKSLNQIQHLRNQLAHNTVVQEPASSRPAYSLEDDDD